MSQKFNAVIAVIAIDIGKNSFHVVGHDERGAIVLRQKWSRGQVEMRLANIPPCLIGMEAGRWFNVTSPRRRHERSVPRLFPLPSACSSTMMPVNSGVLTSAAARLRGARTACLGSLERVTPDRRK
jgi:hypothetical protein